MNPKELGSQQIGREVVVGKRIVPGTDGRVIEFITAFDPNATISPELQQLIIEAYDRALNRFITNPNAGIEETPNQTP